MHRVFYLILSLCLLSSTAMAAVESIGEINVVGDPSGQVPASAKVPLLITLTIDRSQAVPVVEDISTFEILLPINFSMQPEDAEKISFDRVQEPSFSARISGTSVRLVLANQDVITDAKANRVVEIIFSVNTPDLPGIDALFRVRMLNRQGAAIGEFIRAGNADQRINNDDFTLRVIPNVPPVPPATFEASPIASENNVRVTWEVVPDLGEHGGYFVYRDEERVQELADPEATSLLDVNVPPGSHTYSIESYKTPFLRSERTAGTSVTVEADSTPPEPPRDFVVALEANRVVLTWRGSISPDVTAYRVEFQPPGGQIETIAERLPTDVDDDGNFEVIHTESLATGLFAYNVLAVDEVGLTGAGTQEIRLFDKPFPNPFTPLSQDARFNQVTFRATKSSDASFSAKVFDLHGTLVWTGTAEFGRSELKWNGHNDDDELVRSGIYIYQMQLGDEVIGSGTLVVVK